MRWIHDATGRFPQRPYYDVRELDAECEAIVDAFLRAQYGEVKYPITTNDLSILIERETDDLDLFADLDGEDGEIHGVTDFVRGRKPRVRILRELSEQRTRENRLRTTLTHELGHVKFHAVLLRFDHSDQLSLFGEAIEPLAVQCRRQSIVDARPSDWMEWQAGYASGAFLMPISRVYAVIESCRSNAALSQPAIVGTMLAYDMIQRVRQQFRVSSDAARIRLLQLGCLTERSEPYLPLPGENP